LGRGAVGSCALPRLRSNVPCEEPLEELLGVGRSRGPNNCSATLASVGGARVTTTDPAAVTTHPAGLATMTLMVTVLSEAARARGRVTLVSCG
jgi:hypothetical protein